MDVTKLMKGEEIKDWYKIPDSEALVEIKQVPPKKMEMFSEECQIPINPGRSLETKLDQKKYTKMLIDEAVLAWKNIEMDGKPLPCTRENKIKLDECWLSFRLLWNDVVIHAKKMESLKVEEDRKN